jgi:hypothetical protein
MLSYAVQIMIISFLRRMEARLCKVRGLTHIAFMDPMTVNQETVIGSAKANPEDTRTVVETMFIKCKDKESILLAYNCE